MNVRKDQQSGFTYSVSGAAEGGAEGVFPSGSREPGGSVRLSLFFDIIWKPPEEEKE